ncbi:MAG: Dyp-type peroxidase, partial [Proteobacteria bacterium]|nr:Dyp-type peroxidase [Pseudomonadota bacterium]
MAETVTPKNRALSNIHALDIIEQAFYLLKKMPAQILFLYYLGTMPFIVGILYFFNDMSKNAFAGQYCLSASLGLVFLFVWCKFWQAAFCTRTYWFIGEYPKRAWSLGSVLQIITTQTIVHASALIILPLASFILVPFAWVFAMYQMVLIQDAPDTGIKAQLKKEFTAATHHTFVNHILITVLYLFELFVFLNIAIAIYTLPFLTKSLFGVESSFTMGGFNVLNTTFLLSAFCITHLLVDPLFKIVYALLKYNDQSQKTGHDLISGLNRIKKIRRATALIQVVLVFVFLTGTRPAHAADLPEFPDPPAGQVQTQHIQASRLDVAIKNVLSQREYAWRLPRDTSEKIKENHGFVYTALKWM